MAKEKVKLSDFIKEGDNLFWTSSTRNFIMKFILKIIKWFSRSWSSHVVKARKSNLYYSVTTPEPEELDDAGVWKNADEVWIRRPVAQFLITEEAIKKMEELWTWIKENTDYDECFEMGV